MNFKVPCSIAMVMMLLNTSCAKKVHKGVGDSGVVGTWEWIRTDGGFGYHIHHTPASTGKKIELKIDADQKYYFYTNGSLTSKGSYSIETKKCIHDKTDKAYINFSEDQDMMIEKVSQDSLELSDEVYDGLGSIYTRKMINDHTDRGK